jgi:hypothetical protein
LISSASEVLHLRQPTRPSRMGAILEQALLALPHVRAVSELEGFVDA